MALIRVLCKNRLICFFSTHGSRLEANQSKVFPPTVHAWNASISAYVRHGEGEKALDVYIQMEQVNVKPDKITFSSMLKACSITGAIKTGSLIYDQIIRTELDSDMIIGNTLVDMYAKYGDLEQAHRVFDILPFRDLVSWGTIISGYANHGYGFCALEQFEIMQQQGIKPNKVTLLCVLKACSKIAALEKGWLMHDQIVRTGFETDVMIGNALVDMYVKCGNLSDASTVFRDLPHQDVVSWGAMIAGYVDHAHYFCAFELYKVMQKEGIKPGKVIFSCMLRACGSVADMQQGSKIHDQIIRSHLDSDLIIGNTLIDMYAKSGGIEEARCVFDNLYKRDSVSWGAMVAGYTQHGYGLDAVDLFGRMQHEGIKQNEVTVLCVLKACGSMRAMEEGRLIHNEIVQSELASNVVVGNALLDMYAKCGSLLEAYKVFANLSNADVVSWGAMIAGYTMHGYGCSAVDLFYKMQQEGIKPDKYIFSCILKACGNSTVLVKLGNSIHDQVMKTGLGSDLAIQNTLLNMYLKCGNLEAACKVFDESSDRDVVSWGAMILGYCAHGQDHSALECFNKMKQEGIKPDCGIFSSLLQACSSTGALKQGRSIHEQIIQSALELDVLTGCTLVDMYTKCGSLPDARNVFDKLPNRDALTWSALIAGYARHGNCGMAEQCLEQMQRYGLRPGNVVFTSILGACSQAGLLKEGHQFFMSMREEYGITPSVEHYSCMVDLVSRAGYFNEAEDLLQSMPMQPDVVMWRALLTSCRIYGNKEQGRKCFEQLRLLDPRDAAGYVLMSNIYADAQMQEDVIKIQYLRQDASAWKKPGKAWIEIHDRVHEFTVGGKSHLESVETCAKLKALTIMLKATEYVPLSDFVLEELQRTQRFLVLAL